ncbi:EamA family transporter RarD [Pelagibacterium sp. H642]|uniref:EamA family transporter RarD n=1 Tax=Pelagibacterium sp. H642 TaxID=1881069 RepID=UPI002814BE79|nr:EamA family transporter RarD [Pelagibacterium sp. H642]WMT89863.1 EamA family transporter RarD [Pelagibacterium sp. H642]
MTSIEGAPAAKGVRSPRPTGPDDNVRLGVIAALATYTLWGVLPLFFKLLEDIDPVGVVANRILCSLIFVALILWARRQFGEVRTALRDRRTIFALCISAVLIAANWLIFISAVGNNLVLEVSFGYFINPLVSVAIGMVLLSEKLSRTQAVAIGIAIIAIAIQAVGLGAIPWVALALALTFAFYGYVRKTVGVGSAAGLAIETLVLVPVSAIYIVYLLTGPAPDFYADPAMTVLLILTGPLTAVPLVLFAFAARQLRLSTIGMFQYIAPSLQFLTAVFLFGEELTPLRLVSFGLIWVSLAVFSYGSWKGRGVRPA